jgi:hypothetical protein
MLLAPLIVTIPSAPYIAKNYVRVGICKLCRAENDKKAVELKNIASSTFLEMDAQGLSGENASGSCDQGQQQSQGGTDREEAGITFEGLWWRLWRMAMAY